MKNLFKDLENANVLLPVEDDLKSGMIKLTEEGKLRVNVGRPVTRNWHLIKADTKRDCTRWNEIYCQRYKIVPKACRGCWKVVGEVPTLAALFQLAGFMQVEKKVSKCGVDLRWGYGGYGKCMGYWYAPLGSSLGKAQALYRELKEKLEKLYGEVPFKLFLKKGCTEMEAMLPSDRWDERAEEFDRVEKALDEVYELERTPESEALISVINIHQNWIVWRARLGDPTYKFFTGGEALFWREPVHYEEASVVEVVE